MDTDRLKERITDFHRAVTQLEKACAQPKDEFIRDSVIQRFEFSYELAWKMLKLRLEAESLSPRTPKETLQEALQAGFIADGNRWSEIQRMRNLSSHTYDEALADQVHAFVSSEGLPLFRQLHDVSASWLNP